MKSPPKLKPPANLTKWKAFTAAHSSIYVGGFAKSSPVGGGISLSKLVQNSMKGLTTGAWSYTTISQGNSTLVIVGFADKADFDAVKAHFKGQPWKSPPVAAADAFYVAWP